MADEPATPPAESPRSRTYSDEIRARCMAALLAGQGIDRVSADHSVPVGTLKHWRGEARKLLGGTDAMTAKQEKIAELLLDFLQKSLAAQMKMFAVFGDPAFLKTQPIAEVAVAFGIMFDKNMRLLEAMAGKPFASAEPPAGEPVAVIPAAAAA